MNVAALVKLKLSFSFPPQNKSRFPYDMMGDKTWKQYPNWKGGHQHQRDKGTDKTSFFPIEAALPWIDYLNIYQIRRTWQA